MGRTRGVSFKHRVATVLRRVYRCPQAARRVKKPISRVISWTHRLGSKLAEATASKKPDPVPKGHLAVYVGQKDGDFQRILVPVVYFNHPLFGDLLKESEEEYGFDHPGGITLPCRMSEFQTRIKTVQCTRKKTR